MQTLTTKKFQQILFCLLRIIVKNNKNKTMTFDEWIEEILLEYKQQYLVNPNVEFLFEIFSSKFPNKSLIFFGNNTKNVIEQYIKYYTNKQNNNSSMHNITIINKKTKEENHFRITKIINSLQFDYQETKIKNKLIA